MIKIPLYRGYLPRRIVLPECMICLEDVNPKLNGISDHCHSIKSSTEDQKTCRLLGAKPEMKTELKVEIEFKVEK